MLLLKSDAAEGEWIGRRCGRARRHGVPPRSLSLRIPGFRARILARMLDSLVRVTRRVVEYHFVNVLGPLETGPNARPRGLRRVSARLSPASAEPCAGRPCPEGRGPRSLGRTHRAAPGAVSRPARGPVVPSPGRHPARATDVDPPDAKVHRPCRGRARPPGPNERARDCRARPGPTGWFRAGAYWCPAFSCWQFHVLFDSLSRVLFNFPSRYLFAIGLSRIFSLRWNLPPALGCTPKQPDSLKTVLMTAGSLGPETGLSPSVAPLSKGFGPGQAAEHASSNYTSGPARADPISNLSSSRFTRRY